MKKIPLMIDPSRIGVDHSKLGYAKRLQRKYHAMIITDVRVTCNFLKPIKTQFSNLSVLELADVDQTAASWRTLLSELKVIERITLFKCTLQSFKKSFKAGVEIKVSLPTLKYISMLKTDFNYFEYIGETSCEELKIKNRTFEPTDVVPFFPFMKLQNNLTRLACCVNDILFYKMLLNDEENTYKFRLKKLNIAYKNGTDSTFTQSLLDIFEQHKESLEVLEVDNRLNDTAYEYIFRKLKLKSLTLPAYCLPKQSVDFYNALGQNSHLKKLILTDDFNSQVAAQGLFGVYCNVEDLTIKNWTTEAANEILVAIIQNLSKIKTLKMPFLVENITEMPMPSLKSLTIERVSLMEEFHEFLLNHVNLEKLAIKWIEPDINDVMQDAAVRLKKLQHVIFGDGFHPSATTIMALKQNCPDLHTLETSDFDDNSPILPVEEINGLRLYQYKRESVPLVFPPDEGMWHETNMLYFSGLLKNRDYDSDSSMDNSDEDNMEDDDFDRYNYDSNDDFNGGYYGSDDSDLEDYMLREIIGFLIN